MAGIPLSANQEWRENWRTVLAAAFGMSTGVLYLYSAGTLVIPIEKSTGWSRAEIGMGLTVVTIITVVISPLTGALIDKFGARPLALFGITLFPAAFAAIGLTGDSIGSWIFHWALLAVLAFGMSPATWTSAVTNLFDRSRGLALAVTMSGMGIGSLTIPLVSQLLVEAVGWRMTFFWLGAIWGGIGLPLVYFLLRDGRSGPRDSSFKETVRPPGLPLRESLLSRQYFAILGAALCFTFVAMSFVVSIVPILVWQGVDATQAAALASLFGITAIIGRLATGFLLDCFDARVVTTIAMVLPIAAVSLLWSMPSVITLAALSIMIMGFSLGAEVDAIAYLVSRYFGVRNYALLFAISGSASALATASAPLASGLIYDATGGYSLLLAIMLFPCAISAIAIATLGRPKEFGSG